MSERERKEFQNDFLSLRVVPVIFQSIFDERCLFGRRFRRGAFFLTTHSLSLSFVS